MASQLVHIQPLSAAPPTAEPKGGGDNGYFAVVTTVGAEPPVGGVPTPPIYHPPGIWPTPPQSPGLPPEIWPQPPVGIWPNPPGGGGHPGHPLPPGLPPGIWPSPPGGHPGHPLPPMPGHPSHPIVLPPDAPPGTVWPPLDPPMAESGYIIAWVPGQGYKYIKVALPENRPEPK